MNTGPVDNWRDSIRDLIARSGATGRTPDELKPAVKQFSAIQWQLTPKSALEFLDLVFPDGDRDEVLFGILLLTLFKRQLPPATWDAVPGWVACLDNAVHCDQLAINLIGRLIADDRKRWRVLQTWLSAENPYHRRCAIMAGCTVLSKDGCKPKDLIKLSEPLMNDPAPAVHQAVAKAIRQVARGEEDLAVGFLKKWKGRCHPDIFREASQKLSPDARMALGKAKAHRA